MSLNKILGIALLALTSGFVASAVEALEVCPVQSHRPLRSVDVFDGLPEELATLMPDKAESRAGFWELGYVYDADRKVTVRCKYSDGKVIDIKISSRVNRCNYRINLEQTLVLNCK